MSQIVASEGEPYERLNRRQRAALVALVMCPTVKDAARQAGVTRRTLERYMADPVFAEALRREQGRLLRLGVARLGALLNKAVDVVALDMEPGVSGDVRLRAASLVLRHVSQLLEFLQIEQRLTRLEERRARNDGEKAA